MNIYVDIDETICYYKGDRDYNLALPLVDNIKKINKLYDEGHNIKYWTARGTLNQSIFITVPRAVKYLIL